MENKIVLKFDKSTTRLAGNPYGKSVFRKQVSDKIDYGKINTIIFPDHIEKVASSFTQGLFSEIINEVGYEGFNDVIMIKAKSPELEKRIYEDLIY